MKYGLKYIFDSLLSFFSPIIYKLKSRKIILVYHDIYSRKDKKYIGNKAYLSKDIRLDIDKFEAQLQWLSVFADFVSLDEIFKRRKNSGKHRWRVAITFDDAYQNLFQLGLPLFEMYRIPVTIFVPVYYIENKSSLPWWDLTTIISEKYDDLFEISIKDRTLRFNLKNNREKNRFLQKLEYTFFSSKPHEVMQLQSVLEAKARERISLPLNEMVRKEELIKASKSDFITFGSHTARHINMGQATVEEMKAELQESITKLKSWTGKNTIWFAYPFGKSAFRSKESTEQIKSFGFRGALTTESGYIHQKTDMYQIPRLPVDGQWNMQTFRSRVLASNLYATIQKFSS